MSEPKPRRRWFEGLSETEQLAALAEYLAGKVGQRVEITPGTWVTIERLTDPDSGVTTWRLVPVDPPA